MSDCGIYGKDGEYTEKTKRDQAAYEENISKGISMSPGVPLPLESFLESNTNQKSFWKKKKKDKLSESRKEELLLNLSRLQSTGAILNVAPNYDKKNFANITYGDDPVEYFLTFEVSNLPVINIENDEEYKFVLSNVPSTITDLIITGGHGNYKGTKLGKIKPENCSPVKDALNVYFPDCNIGKNKQALQKSFGSNATIYAKSKNTNESDVKKFLEFADRNPNISSSELQSYFKHRIREEN